MGLFDLFRSKSKKEKYGHVQALVALALADGNISEHEKAIIAKICIREGLSMKDLQKAIESVDPKKHTFPKDDDKKVRYLIDMVLLMMVDGNIDEDEVLLCKVTARAMGFHESVIDAMVLEIIEAARKELNMQ
jgi:tellurite resistance protein